MRKMDYFVIILGVLIIINFILDMQVLGILERLHESDKLLFESIKLIRG